MLNHYAHQTDGPGKKARWDTNGDGVLQKSEADNWGFVGEGKPITVNGKLIDLKGFKTSSLTQDTLDPSLYAYDTTDVFSDLPDETANTYGGSYFKNVNGKWQMQSQGYHYEMRTIRPLFSKDFGFFKDLGRNIGTLIGSPSAPYSGMVSTPMGPMPTYQNFTSYQINVKY